MCRAANYRVKHLSEIAVYRSRTSDEYQTGRNYAAKDASSHSQYACAYDGQSSGLFHTAIRESSSLLCAIPVADSCNIADSENVRSSRVSFLRQSSLCFRLVQFV